MWPGRCGPGSLTLSSRLIGWFNPNVLSSKFYFLYLICLALVCRPFTWMAEGMARLYSNCLERFQRRASASTASTQPDPEVS
jgi:hypothetical protein